MKFRYGISPQSLMRWKMFERIEEVQAERGEQVGEAVSRYLVTAELAAIERATSEHERRELEASVILLTPLERLRRLPAAG